jgi:hypothetical protein
MPRIRGLLPADLPAVAALFRSTFGTAHWPGANQLEAYLQDALRGGPWYDEALSSLVYETDDGAVGGFLGVLPRPMVLRGRRLRAVVSTKFMVAGGHGRGGPAAVALLRAVMAMPHDLVLADVGSDDMRRLWEALGGGTVLLYSLYWRRQLRPFRHAVSWLRKQKVYGRPALGLRPFHRPADALFGRLSVNRFHRPPAGSATSELDEATFLAHYAKLAGPASLRVEFDAPAYRWTLEMAAAGRPASALRKRAVRAAGGEVLGWYICAVERARDWEVLHFLSRPAATADVLSHLFAEAWANGAVTIHGRINPQQIREFSARHAAIGSGPPWMLAHSRHPEVLEALYRGNASLSRLEGEW